MAANPMVSNGTCYWGPGEETDPIFIPCGNDAFGHKTCCQAGDKCVSSKACYNDLYGITYLVGCSDPDYLDDSCPDKPGLTDMTWVGLVTCAGSNLWSPCSEDGNPSTLTSADPCTCNTTSPVVAFTDATSLTDHARLPTALGESVIWAPGFLPTATTSAPSSASPQVFSSPPFTAVSSVAPPITAAPTSAPTSSSFSSSFSPSLSSSSSSYTPATQAQISGPTGMSTGTKAGIGAGVTIAVLAIITGIAALHLMRRRRAKGNAQVYQDPASQDHNQSTEPKDAWSPSTVATTTVSELDSTAARPWSMRQELQGSYKHSPGTMDAVAEENEQKESGDEHGVVQPQAHGLGVFVELQG